MKQQVSLTEYICIWQHLLFLWDCLLPSEIEQYLGELLLTVALSRSSLATMGVF